MKISFLIAVQKGTLYINLLKNMKWIEGESGFNVSWCRFIMNKINKFISKDYAS